MAGKPKILKTVVDVAGRIDPSLAKTLNATTKKLDKVELKAVAAFAVVGAAAYKAVKYLKNLGDEFDKVEDAIRIGTGATGEALSNLVSDFDAVYSSVPTEMETAGTAITEYNTRLGLTGEKLQKISKQAIQVSDILKEDINTVVEKSSKTFAQWDIDADKMGDSMDYIFKVSQNTGIGFSDLMTKVQEFAPQLRSLGYNFESSAALVGQLDKAGVNVSETLAAMKKSVGTLAKSSKDGTIDMQKYYTAIQNAGNEAEATTIANNIFGSKAGSTVAAAIRKGTLSVDALTKSLSGNGETIAGVAEETYDYAEMWKIARNKLNVALKPVANTIFNVLNKVMPVITKAVQKATPLLVFLANIIGKAAEATAWLIDWLFKGVDALTQFKIPLGVITGLYLLYKANVIGAAIANKYEAVTAAISKKAKAAQIIVTEGLTFAKIKEKIATVASTIATNAWTIASLIAAKATLAFGAALQFLTSPITLVILAIGALIAIGVLLYKNWDKVSSFLKIAWGKIKVVFVKSFEFLKNVFFGWFGLMKDRFMNYVGLVVNPLKAIIKFIKNVFTGNWKGAWQGVKDIFSSIMSGIGNIFKLPLNFIIKGINKFIGALNKIKIPKWVPEVGGKGINIPKIPLLYKGGFTEGVSIAGEKAQEAVISFDNRYRNQNMEYWAEAGSRLGVASKQSLQDMTTSQNSNEGIRSGLLGKLFNKSSGSGNKRPVSINQLTFAPQITMPDGSKPADLLTYMKKHIVDFVDMIMDEIDRRDEGDFADDPSW